MVISGTPRKVLQNARKLKTWRTGWPLTNKRPVRSSSTKFVGLSEGIARLLKEDSEEITARNETPFNRKHAAAPKPENASPATIGPIMRAKLNWIEFSAIAFGMSFFSTSIGIN